VIRLTQLSSGFADITQVMSYSNWLRAQVNRLEEEIREHSVFDSAVAASPSQLAELRSKVVIHTFLKQQMLRREAVRPTIPNEMEEFEIDIDFDFAIVDQPNEPEFDTQEILIRKLTRQSNPAER
jgi:hypothetical protein